MYFAFNVVKRIFMGDKDSDLLDSKQFIISASQQQKTPAIAEAFVKL